MLIDGRIPEGEVEKYLSNYQIDLTGPCYVVSILHISTTDIPQNMNPFLLGVSVKKLAEEHMEGEWKSRILMYLGDIVVITQLEEQEQITAFTDFMDQFCRLAKHVCEATVTAGIGYVCDNLPDIRQIVTYISDPCSYRCFTYMLCQTTELIHKIRKRSNLFLFFKLCDYHNISQIHQNP